jgi:DNA-binding CsgD family transcriptional regulator
MDNELKPFSGNGLLPQQISELRIGDLLSDRDTEVTKKGNSFKIKRKTDTEVLNLEIRLYDETSVISQTHTMRDKPASKKHETIAELRREGKSQQEIADILGTTQSNISKIEKQFKKL